MVNITLAPNINSSPTGTRNKSIQKAVLVNYKMQTDARFSNTTKRLVKTLRKNRYFNISERFRISE
jgi:hypothetical protein